MDAVLFEQLLYEEESDSLDFKRDQYLFGGSTDDEKSELLKDKTEIIGKTPCGRATVIALRLNFEQAVNARKLWVSVGWYPPKRLNR